MFSFALIGPDGTGKSTISKNIENSLSVSAKYIYMGINVEASNIILPTTWIWYKIKHSRGKGKKMGGPPNPKNIPHLSLNPVRRFLVEIKSAMWITNLIAEEWFRQIFAWLYQICGYIVIFDRHFFFDYFEHHIMNAEVRTISERFHGFMLNRVFPKPDYVICLDAPAEVLFARKGEGTVELLDKRRKEYLQSSNNIKNFVVVDATKPIDDVTRDVCNLVLEFNRLKRARQ